MADNNYVPPVVLASDTVDLQGSTFSRLGDAATKGLGSAAISGALSVYNTALDYAGKESLDTATVIRDFDNSWGDYYEQNKEIIDLGGFVATSFVPGAIGIKALKLARSGQALGPVSRALNLAPTKSAENLKLAMRELAKSGGTVTAEVTAAKRAKLAWDVGDQILTSAAAELAIVATMNDSPIFEGDTAWDFAKNVTAGALFGGAIGGVFDAFATRGVLKGAQKAIEANKRDFDTVFDPTRLGLSKSDEVLLFAENLLKLPDDFYNTNFTYKLGGKDHVAVLDTGEAFKATKTRAEKVAFDTLMGKFNELAEGGEVTGQAMFQFIAGKIKSGKEAGETSEQIADTIQGYLQGVNKVRNLTPESGSLAAPAQFFVNLKPKGFEDLFSNVKGNGTGKQAYYLTTTDPRELKFGSVARMGFGSVDEAFEAGYDAVVNTAGHISINPKSAKIKSTPDAALKNKFYLDLETGSLTDEVILTGGDLLKKADDFKPFADRVYISGKNFPQLAAKLADLADSALNASARFMWASSSALKDTDFKKRVMDWSDFALLDRAKGIAALQTAGEAAIRMPDGSVLKFTEIVDIPSVVNELKLEFLQKALGSEVRSYDMRHLQAHLNVSRDWLESAIANNFAKTPEQLKEFRSLDSYFKPQTVEMEWDTGLQQVASGNGFIGPNHYSTMLLGHEYRLRTRERVQENSFLSVMGEDARLFQDADVLLSQGVSEQGAGATGLGFSNADYGDRARLFVQDTGKATALTMQKWRDRDISSIAPQINRIRDNPQAAAELGVLTTALRRDPQKYYLEMADDVAGTPYRLIDKEAYQLLEKNPNDFASLDEAVEYLQGQGRKGSYQIQNTEVADFFNVSRALNRERLSKQTTLLNATGIARNLDAEVVYAPPVDTRRYPYFAFVSAKQRIGGITDLSMITAKSEDQLRQLAAKVGEDYEVIYKQDTVKFFKAKGQYDYSMQINDSRVNSDMQRRGILGDFFPETRAENVLEDYVRWHGNASDNLVRTAVQVKNRQFVNELNFLSEQFQSASTSAVKGFGVLKSKIADPFGDYVKTMLNVSKQGEYPLLDGLNEFTDRVSKELYSKLDGVRESIFGKKGADLASLEYTNKLLDEAGLGTPYKSMEEYLLANEKMPKNLLKSAFQKVNYWLATTTLRLDFANSLVNIISTPIMLGTEMSSIKSLIGSDAQAAGKLTELLNVKVPGQAAAIPSTTKLVYNAMQNFFGPEKQALMQRYRENGDIRDVAQLYHEVLDDLAYQPLRTPAEWVKKMESAVEKGAKITGNTFAEDLTRFVSADVMRQLSQPLVEAGKMTLKEQNAYISSFVNRVQGNYIYSQRPVAFQGTVGAAISLFQTYSFNVLQQLFRHMENGDKKTLAVFGGLQASIYGMNGLPFFDAVNTHLIGRASGNPEHKDSYYAASLLNKELGDWMLYGTASAFPVFGSKSPALFSRGDINPRNVTLLPVNPLDVPAVSASIRLVDTLNTFGKQVANGADLSGSFLQALEHQGWSRPLAGFAQLLAGESRTSKGSLISAANDLETTSWLSRIPDRLVNYGGVSRLMGARPMDEAVALNQLYRNKAYQAIDRQKIEALGSAVKTKLAANQMPDEEELEGFMQSYVNSGGRQETFSSAIQKWSRDSNQSIVNQMAQNVGSPYGRKMQQLMGGEMLQDYNSIAEQE